MIELQGVKKLYEIGESVIPALNGLSLKINKGEFVAILGASGSGKSTAMNMIGSLDIPSEGKVLLEGADISHAEESELAQLRGKKIGFIFQSFNLIPSLTALGNVMLPMTFQNVPREQRKIRATQLLMQVGLKERMSNLPSQLSGGERQRVAIARALINDPEIILADEPTGNLDSVAGANVIELLQNLWKKEGKTIIMVTHDLKLASHAKRIVQLKDGQILKSQNFHS